MVSSRVLLVEDDAFLREIYSDTLAQSGFVLETAIDGAQAFDKIKEGNWDILLLDIILPNMDGIEVLRKLHNDPSFSSQLGKPVIFLTNLDNDNEMKQALELGKGYIVKSKVSPGELVAKIQAILASSVEA